MLRWRRPEWNSLSYAADLCMDYFLRDSDFQSWAAGEESNTDVCESILVYLFCILAVKVKNAENR